MSEDRRYSPPESPESVTFPDGFLWGASTAAHQVEGHQHNNWSLWEAGAAEELAATAPDRLAEEVPRWDEIRDEATNPGNYISGEAADHYHQYERDFDILRELGLNAYRFSVEWSRIEPEKGRFNQEALNHYEAVVDALRERNIEPFVVLHHFTDPAWLENEGGWHSHEAAYHFARYAEKVAERLGGKVRYWVTINEANSYIFMKYLGGDIWPAWPDAGFNILKAFKARKVFASAHERASQAIKKHEHGAQIGFVHTSELFRGSGFISKLLARLLQRATNGFTVGCGPRTLRERTIWAGR
ncbi:hypothetical protein BRC21_01920 [Candidatus Saccharibacteria bacterium SW_7_54_9]|nr:MAG: hypothetical protein BRC21_01920 [Candidatus Saccharibacteria bacterium SW_7_54_9]